MNKKFYEEFIINRNDTLKEIMINKEAWYNYIKFWSNNLGYHSSDNLINIYSYNKDGTMYATYDEWNSIDIGRRIKRGSKGIPIYRDGFKTYVFDISQTYGKQFKIWRYNGLLKNELYELYNRKYQMNFNPLNYTDEEKFEMIILSNIENSIRENYDTLKEFETNFIIMSVFSIVCSKLGINASLYSDNSFIYIAKLNEESILKSLQIINREACNHYRNFFNNYKNIIKVNNMLENLAQDNIINTDLQASLEALEMTSEVDYETLKKIYELKREKYLEINDINNINTYRISDIDIKDDGYYINDEKITDEEFEKSFRDAEEENFDNTYGLNAGKDIIEIEYNKYNIRDLESAYNYLNSIHDNDLILEELQLEIEDLLESDEQHYLEATNLLNRTIERLDELEKIRSSEEYNHEEEIIDVPKPKKKSKPKKDNNNLEQLSLFEKRENLLANKICDIFNHFDTIYKDTFRIYSVELQAWDHIPSKKRNLSIILESDLIEEYASENSFTYFNKDKTEEEKINNEIANNYFLQELYKDKDFSINFTPNMIHIYYNNFDYKDIDLSIDSYKKIIEPKQTEELNKKADSSFAGHTLTSTGNNVVLSDSVIKYYNSDRDEIIAVDEEKQEELIPRKNYHITDNNIRESFGQKIRYKDNVDAINLLKKIENENRFASSEEQEILAKYVGWGGIADAFSHAKEEWNSENQELKSLLTDEEYKEANSSVLTAFYTPNVAIDGIYKALERFGFENGNILEPSCGIGNFFGRLPEKCKDSKLYGVEKDSISGRIAKLLYPNAKIEINGYEDTKFSDNFFDVAIGNVPFGDIPVFDKKYKNNFFIHDYFF